MVHLDASPFFPHSITFFQIVCNLRFKCVKVLMDKTQKADAIRSLSAASSVLHLTQAKII